MSFFLLVQHSATIPVQTKRSSQTDKATIIEDPRLDPLPSLFSVALCTKLAAKNKPFRGVNEPECGVKIFSTSLKRRFSFSTRVCIAVLCTIVFSICFSSHTLNRLYFLPPPQDEFYIGQSTVNEIFFLPGSWTGLGYSYPWPYFGGLQGF